MLSVNSYKRNVAIIYTVALFLDRLDLTIVNITLPTISKVFKVPMVATDWISMAFLIAMAISIPVSIWLGKRLGLKKVFVLSLFLFGAGSSLCAAAPNLHVLIALRFIQGLGGGMLIPVGMTFIYRLYEKSEYASITSYTFIPALVAPALAPFLGGVLLTLIGWRFVFMFSGPICLLLAIVSLIVLKEFEAESVPRFDWRGFIFIALFFIDLFVSLAQFGHPLKQNESLIYLLIALPILLVLFVLREKKAAQPIIHLSYFRRSIFNKAILIQLCFQAVHLGSFFLIGMYLQLGAGLSAIYAGLIMGMQAIGAMAVSRFSVKLFNNRSERFPIMLGFLGVAILSPCALLIKDQSVGFVLLGMLLFTFRGVFSGLCGTPIQTLSVIGFEHKDISSVSAVFNIFRQVSISLGVAISSLLLALGMSRVSGWEMGQAMPFSQAVQVFKYGFAGLTVIAIIGFFVALSIKPASTKFNS